MDTVLRSFAGFTAIRSGCVPAFSLTQAGHLPQGVRHAVCFGKAACERETLDQVAPRLFPGVVHDPECPFEAQLVLNLPEPERMMHKQAVREIKCEEDQFLLAHGIRRHVLVFVHDTLLFPKCSGFISLPARKIPFCFYRAGKGTGRRE